jgi:hypothetical protein
LLHTPIETPIVRRVRARGLQVRRAFVGRVPSRGAQGCEISRLRIRLPCAPVSCTIASCFGGYFRPERLRGCKDFWSLPPVVKPEADDDV